MRRARLVRSPTTVQGARVNMAGRLLLVILVALDVNQLVSVCGQELYLGDNCDLKTGGFGTCKRTRNCPYAQQGGVRPEVCYVERNVSVVCCPEGRVTVPSKRTRPEPVATTKKTPIIPPQPKPTPAPPKPVGASKSWSKCEEYGKEVYREVTIQSLTLDEEVVTEADCAQAAEELIVGGKKCVAKEFPHMATLGFGDEPTIAWLCGGSLISDRFVLTAAHCRYAPRRGNVKWVRLGDLNLVDPNDDARPQTIEVLQAIPHPGYKSPSHYNDIALLKLKTAVKFDAYVRPACLNTNPKTPEGEQAVATGWGVVEWSNTEMSKDLMKVELKFHTAQRCNDTFKSLITASTKLVNGFTEDTMICAGDPQNKRDTCVGDSGGPLQKTLTTPFCMYSIVGLTSFGSRACGETNSPAVYTRVSHYVPWIESIVWP